VGFIKTKNRSWSDEKNTVKIVAGVMKRIMYKWKRMNENNTA